MQHHLEGKCKLRGRVDNTSNALGDADLIVITSDFKGMLNSLMEVMAIGLPTICTDCPVGGELMRSSNLASMAFLVFVWDHMAMVDAMNRVADDVEYTQELSGNGVRVRERFHRSRSVSGGWHCLKMNYD